MLQRPFVCVVVGLALCGGALQGQDKKDGKKDGKSGEVVGKVKMVDMAKSSFTITTAEGKDRMFTVTKDTKFVGPKGGVSDEGLKDDRLGKGYEVKVTPAADMKTAKEVKLPYRKKASDKKDKK